ncbi:NRDE-2, necessary for RNA interference domain containing protein [Amanita muscaria]
MSAPSFSSFPPSFASFPDVDHEQPSQDEREPRRKDKRKRNGDQHRDKKRKREADERGHKHRRYHADNDLLTTAKSANTPAADTEPDWRLFYSDKRGDMLNIQFGGLHVGHVPKYNLIDGGRSILGLSSAWTARRSGKGIIVDVRGQRKLRELTDSGVRKLLAAEPRRRLLASGDVYKHKEIDGYLPLPSNRAREDSQAYRSISQSKVDSESESDFERESESNESADDGPTLTSLQESLKSLEQQLSQNPTSVNLWLSLLAQTLSTVPLLSKNANKARAEIALSVLSRAMAADPVNAKSTVLRIKYLKAAEEVWQEDKMKNEWEGALNVGGVEMWMEWLGWRIRKARRGLDGVLEDALRATSAFGHDRGEIAKLRILWRVAVAFQSAGYTERATALFQAQAELTFNTPFPLRGVTFVSLLDSLEEFWESEVPRIGESGAQGWAAWVASRITQGAPSVSQPVPVAPPELDPYRQWAANELNADRASIFPARSTDEVAESDPYSTVLFSDIRPLLFDLKTSEGKDGFRLAWLCFLGLPVPGFHKSISQTNVDEMEAGWDDRWCFTHLCKPAKLRALFPDAHETRQLEADSITGVLVGREKDYGSSFGPVKNWGFDVHGPLHAVVGRVMDGRKRKEKRITMWEKEDLEGTREDHVRAIFAQLRMGDDDLEWDNLALAFEAALGMKSALKLSRQFLSVSQASSCRWASHALLERTRGRLDDARKVYHTVLIASASSGKCRKAQLWWDWAEMEWLSGAREEALAIIMRSAGVEGKGGVAVLRAKRGLEDAAQINGKWKEREAWIKLSALLELLTSGDVNVTFQLFDSYPAEEGSSEHESLLISSLLIAYYHSVILQNPMPPALLRERTQRAIEVYPSNSIILGLFLEGEKGQGVWGRIRMSMGETGGKSKDVARRVEEVWLAGWEKGRWTNEIERTRSGLSIAIEHERTRGSPIIWRIYIEFEMQANDLQRAKNLLYRAIAECPLVKELYLLAFGPLRSVFSKQELAHFADTMAERGIRTRQGLDDILDNWTMGRTEEKEKEDNEGPLDEIEENAQQLRRLMPY